MPLPASIWGRPLISLSPAHFRTLLRGALPISQGRNAAPNMVHLGTLDSPANGAVDITAAYKARFGNPPAGTKVFVSVNQNLNGWENVPHIFSAIVPAST